MFIRTRKKDRSWHYSAPGWFGNNLLTLQSIAKIYAATGDKPYSWGSLKFTLPIADVQTFYRRPRGPVAPNYGHAQGRYFGRNWAGLVQAAKKHGRWFGSGPLWLQIDKARQTVLFM